MEITLLEQSKDKLEMSFILKNSSPALANALRRAAIGLVPTMAIEDIEIRKNFSVLYDEILAHRLGLITIKTDLSNYVLPALCKCKGEGCANCQVTFTIAVKGPGLVTAKDLKFNDPKIKAVYDDTIIVKLEKNQEIEIEGVAILGQGGDHTKFTPGVIYYKYKPVIKIERQPENVNKVVELCPKNILENKKGVIEINKDKVFECHLCEACVQASDGAIKLNEKNDEYLFYVESFGQLSAADLIKNAISQILDATKEFTKSIKELNE